MYNGKTVGVVIPAYNEERLIAQTLTTVPAFVDRIYVVDDGSKDRTGDIIAELAAVDARIVAITHEKNSGLGQSLIDGYVRARDEAVDIVAKMDGDGQMHPDDLQTVIDPVATGLAGYAKGNRLLVADVAEHMPLHRLIGNSMLTFLSKFATGYWHVIDPQCGYTAIAADALRRIPIETMTKGYGYNAHVLNMLNIVNVRVADVPVKPVYGEEQSKIKLYTYIPRVSLLLIRLFFHRLIGKYLVRNFNPLCLSYICSIALLLLGAVPIGALFLHRYFFTSEFPRTTLLVLMFLSLAGLQILLSAIQYDMEDNRRLSVFPGDHEKKSGGAAAIPERAG